VMDDLGAWFAARIGRRGEQAAAMRG
jgi:hypothetical protein